MNLICVILLIRFLLVFNRNCQRPPSCQNLLPEPHTSQAPTVVGNFSTNLSWCNFSPPWVIFSTNVSRCCVSNFLLLLFGRQETRVRLKCSCISFEFSSGCFLCWTFGLRISEALLLQRPIGHMKYSLLLMSGSFLLKGTNIPKGIYLVHFVPLFHQISENGTLITQLGLRCHHILRNTSCFLTKCVSKFFCQSQGQFCTKLCSFLVPFKTNLGPFLVHLKTNLGPFWSQLWVPFSF